MRSDAAVKSWSFACAIALVVALHFAPTAHAQDLKSIRDAAKRIAPLHKVKPKASPGDWLASHPEKHQSFEKYRSSRPNRPTDKHTTIYVQPLGDFSPAQERVLASARELLSIYYGLPVKSLTPIALDRIPASARRNDAGIGHEQLLTTYLLNEFLPPLRPDDAVAVMVLTPVDLWPGEGWNFVFGQGSFRERVGVYSLARYGNPDGDSETYQQCLRRTLKVAVHEMGHMLGISHCTAYECGMNGSNHLAELDRNQLAFCPECEQKVWWSCRLDPRPRFNALQAFAHAHHLAAEEQLWKASSEHVAQATARAAGQ